MRKAGTAIAQADVLVLQLESPLANRSCCRILRRPEGYPCHPQSRTGPGPADALLRHVSVLTPNETEAERLTGIRVANLKTAELSARTLLKRGVKAVILTLGSNGAWIATHESQQHVPGFKVKAVDTTAAGDTFTGALAVALAEGQPLLRAARFANAAAALSVTKRGAQDSVPRLRDIHRLLHRGE